MACPLCGDVCGCEMDSRSPVGLLHESPGRGSDASEARLDPGTFLAPARHEAQRPLRPRFVVDPQLGFAAGDPAALRKNDAVQAHCTEARMDRDRAQSAELEGPSAQCDLTGTPGGDGWRREVSARLNRYRARRGPRGPRYPSLRLKFESPAAQWTAGAERCEGASCSAASVVPVATRQAVAVEKPEFPESVAGAAAQSGPAVAPEPAGSGKIIEFPRSSFDPPPPLSELAEAVIDRPRILEAPEVVPPPPALGGILIEEISEKLQERRPGIDMPLQSAPPGRRLLAAAVDAAIVLLAGAVFAGIVFRIVGTLPARREVVGFAGGLCWSLWAFYEYLLIVYTGTTPGLRLAKLRLSRFDRRPADRRLRRWRVLAGFLSGIALGLGYAWHFFDEDALCWHDRVTRTYLAP